MYNLFLRRQLSKCVSAYMYVQGQYSAPNTREYFYYIDHQGQLFLDDAKMKNFVTCFKDKAFLAFFFKRLILNSTGRYEDTFPYISPCGHETNYVRCDDLPIVYTHILDRSGHVIEDVGAYGQTPVQSDEHLTEMLSYGGAGNLLTTRFDPSKLCMLPTTGRVYHSGPYQLGGMGLVKSSLASELSQFFVYDKSVVDGSCPPVMFSWKGKTTKLDPDVLNRLHQMKAT